VAASRRKVAILFLAAVILAAAFGVFLFRVKDLSPGYVQLRAYMDDASGLTDGTQVRLDGIPIGYLDAQKLTNSRDPRRKVEFDLKVKERFLRDIPVDSVVGLASDNLLGELYIGVHRGRSTEHVQRGAELHATQAADITRMMAQMSQQLDRLQDIFTRADKLVSGVDTGSGAIGKIVKSPQLRAGGGVSAEFNRLMEDVHHGHGTLTKLLFEDPLDVQLQAPLKQLEAIRSSADTTSARLKEFQDGLDLATKEFHTLQGELKAGRGSFGKIDQLQARIDELKVKIDGMMARINAGGGTIGQLMVNPQLNEALAGTTREFQELAKGLKSNPKKFVSIKVF
jgi:phospholipid/cholesterol/gamma-HCH transport system substrate-binding protein